MKINFWKTVKFTFWWNVDAAWLKILTSRMQKPNKYMDTHIYSILIIHIINNDSVIAFFLAMFYSVSSAENIIWISKPYMHIFTLKIKKRFALHYVMLLGCMKECLLTEGNSEHIVAFNSYSFHKDLNNDFCVFENILNELFIYCAAKIKIIIFCITIYYEV